MKTILLLLIIFLFARLTEAQEYGNYTKMPFHFGLFPPISTNGLNAGNCVNQLSINLISGYSAGLSGFEFAGISNTERDFVRGAQFAGIGNFVNGDFVGFQFAGFGNFSKATARGFQFAGFANINDDEAHGVQFAGFTNLIRGKSVAIQSSGFLNYCHDIQGIQMTGFANLVNGNGKAIQLSGFVNAANGYVKGIQASGFANYCLDMEGIQATGFANLTNGNMKGIQASGFANISRENIEGIQVTGFANIADDVEGLQVSGFINKAEKLNGLQLGVINLADTVSKGIPIGFLSFVRKGYHAIEISAGEGLNAQLAIKLGVDQFYNIFAVGTQFLSLRNKWGFGYGIGTHIVKNENFSSCLELMSYQINEGELWTNRYNALQQVKINFSHKISENAHVFVGPSINLMVTDRNPNDSFRSSFAPYEVYSHVGKNSILKGWFGFTVGIRIEG